MEYLFNELRFWDDCPPVMAELDAQDATLDREESLSERYAFQLGEDMGVLRFAVDQEELDPPDAHRLPAWDEATSQSIGCLSPQIAEFAEKRLRSRYPRKFCFVA